MNDCLKLKEIHVILLLNITLGFLESNLLNRNLQLHKQYRSH